MRPWIIKLAIGVLGFGGGFAAGYYTHKRMNNIQFEEVTEDEMKKVIEEAGKKTGISSVEAEPKNEDTVVSEDIGAAQELPETPDDIRNSLQGKTPYMKADAETKTAYEKLWKAANDYSGAENADNYPVWKSQHMNRFVGPDDEAENESPGEENFDEEFLEQLEQEAAEAGNAFEDPPHQIDLISFYNDHPDWDRVTIHWYMDDNTWIDEHEDVIADIQSYAGVGIGNPFDEDPIDDDPDVRFWANANYSTNYEFIRHHRSWAETNGEVK